MSGRTIEIDGDRWAVSGTGRITQYDKDEFSLRFRRLPPAPEQERAVRYSPQGAKNRENSLAQLTDAELRALFRVSQPSWTSAELEYRS
jgi:hypothetical protein